MAQFVAGTTEVSLRNDEYIVLDGADFVRWTIRRANKEWPESAMSSVYAREIVNALQRRIRSYSDYRLLQQLT